MIKSEEWTMNELCFTDSKDPVKARLSINWFKWPGQSPVNNSQNSQVWLKKELRLGARLNLKQSKLTD